MYEAPYLPSESVPLVEWEVPSALIVLLASISNLVVGELTTTIFALIKDLSFRVMNVWFLFMGSINLNSIPQFSLSQRILEPESSMPLMFPNKKDLDSEKEMVLFVIEQMPSSTLRLGQRPEWSSQGSSGSLGSG